MPQTSNVDYSKYYSLPMNSSPDYSFLFVHFIRHKKMFTIDKHNLFEEKNTHTENRNIMKISMEMLLKPLICKMPTTCARMTSEYNRPKCEWKTAAY